MNNIFIQPRVETYTQYLNLASNSGFSFEIGDFASPAVLNDINEFNYRKDFYKHYLKDFENRVTLHGAFIDIIVVSPDYAVRRASQEKVRMGLETAMELGAESIVFHTGYNSVIRNPRYRDNWLKQSALFWDQMAEEYDTEILLENVWDKSPNTIAELLQNMYNTNVNICLDIGHHNVFSNESLENWFDVLGDRITYLHYNDNMGDFDASLPPGEGNVNWQMVHQLVSELRTDPRVVLEVQDIDKIHQSVKYLKEKSFFPFNN